MNPSFTARLTSAKKGGQGPLQSPILALLQAWSHWESRADSITPTLRTTAGLQGCTIPLMLAIHAPILAKLPYQALDIQLKQPGWYIGISNHPY
ncbi:hypothetical protein CPB86DRAFT_779473 [Serendipita vermifera]|nr:hypothetical protein CPB86DRAFT_779473 [Serendipita vermifera]